MTTPPLSPTTTAATPRTATGEPREASQKKSPRPRSKLWLFVWLAFALQITAWYFWIKLASQHRVEEVPLATSLPSETLNADASPAPSHELPNETIPTGQAASVDDHDRPAPAPPSSGRAANEPLAQ